jgi:hypothetical protein
MTRRTDPTTLALRRAGLLLGLGVLLATAHTLAAGAETTVEFLMPDTVAIDEGKRIVITSGAMGKKKEVGDCAPEALPAQNATVLDPNGGASTRVPSGFVPLGATLTAGTRLGKVTGGRTCGPGYRHFTGIVE